MDSVGLCDRGKWGRVYFATSIAGRLFILECLRTEDVADAESDEGQRVGGYFLGVTGDVGCVPGKEKHECCAECAGLMNQYFSSSR